jgi:Transposase DDE domain
LLLYAIERVKTQVIFDRDPYETRREALPGSRLLKVLVFYQMLKDPSQRGLVRIVKESQDAQAALGGHLARNTLANALCQRDLEQMIEAWALLLAHYSPYLARMGKKFARVAAVDASLIKLSLDAFDWAKYREHSGAAKITCVFDWVKGVPQQFVFTAAGKIHDLKATSALAWSAGWTYLFDRGYFSFDLLGALLTAGAHFVIRFKDGVEHRILERHKIPDLKLPEGMRAIRGDWTVLLPGWDRELICVPSAGWRIREIPDCASSPKTHVEFIQLFVSLLEVEYSESKSQAEAAARAEQRRVDAMNRTHPGSEG